MPETVKRTEPEFKIHTDLHAGHFTQETVEQHQHDTVFLSLVNAHDTARNAAERILAARKVALANTLQTESKNIEEFSKAHEKAFNAASGKLDNAIQYARQAITDIEQQLNAPVDAPKNAGTASDIRNHVKHLDREQRSAFVADAMANNDHETLTAILSAPAYLSGLTPAQHQHHKTEFKKRQNPELFSRLDLLKKTEARVTSAGSKLVELSGQIHNHDASKLKAAKEADERARKALSGLESM
ncbi:hypothetical protein MLC59_02580 [Marinobacter bryozoorum]|uniref:hypothetical protein n=1 Tax=Marinobacter bryozoorum TaxID=256324 RepID=UPI0020033C83|nr:hypothetical protein [Marinobacter bryozoorum]MCK7543054.1 hypothetical protein [Marinobacter bryozoorum]